MEAGESAYDILKALRFYTSIAVDLALYSTAFMDSVAAYEVLRLEDRIDEYYKRLIARIAIAVRSPEDEKLAIGAYELASALDKASDAAGDLASLVLGGRPIHKFVRATINCCGEVISLVEVKRPITRPPSLADLLMLKRGGTYRLAPSWSEVRPGDIIVARGPMDEILDIVREAGGEVAVELLRSTPSWQAAVGGDDFITTLIQVKSVARLMLDLALHSLASNDRQAAAEVLELEDLLDSLYTEALRVSYAVSSPGLAEEYVSVAVFAKSMESIGDAATKIARLVAEGENSEFLERIASEAEEAYVKLEVARGAAGKSVQELGLADMGLTLVALRRGTMWLLPVPGNAVLAEGDVIIAKYYVPDDPRVEEEMLARLESLGLRVAWASRSVWGS